jgi:hypothetical protein
MLRKKKEVVSDQKKDIHTRKHCFRDLTFGANMLIRNLLINILEKEGT